VFPWLIQLLFLSLVLSCCGFVWNECLVISIVSCGCSSGKDDDVMMMMWMRLYDDEVEEIRIRINKQKIYLDIIYYTLLFVCRFVLLFFVLFSYVT